MAQTSSETRPPVDTVKSGTPEAALDFPQMDDDLVVIWHGNDHIWPDARRETHYIGESTHILKGFALFTSHPAGAKTFPDVETAEAFLRENEKARPYPYPDTLQITTVAELKQARGYMMSPDEQAGIVATLVNGDIISIGSDLPARSINKTFQAGMSILAGEDIVVDYPDFRELQARYVRGEVESLSLKGPHGEDLTTVYPCKKEDREPLPGMGL